MKKLFMKLWEKGSNKIKLFLFCRNYNGNLYIRNYKAKNVNKILLYFPLDKYMHLGDHLFFEPLLRNLKNKGFDVSIWPTKQMKFYFLKLGYKITEESKLAEYDIIITRTDFYKFVKNEKNVLMYDYINKKIKDKICKDIVMKIFGFLSIKEEKNFDYKPLNISVEKDMDIELDKNKKYIIFNNYLYSGKWFINNKCYISMEEQAKKFKNAGYNIIHLGTIAEKNEDKNIYNYVDLDLRGITSVADLFFLSNHNNVEINIGFDGFLMHLFFMNGKRNYVVLRNKITENRKIVTKKYLNPPFHMGEDNQLEYLN